MHRPTPRLRGDKGVKQRARRMLRSRHLCERCAGEGRWKGKGLGRVTVAKVVNHIVPLAHGGPDTDENTENLCKPCDLFVTAEQFGHRVKREIGLDGFPI